MKFTDTLKSLEAKATDGPWEAGHPISKQHYGVTAYDHTYAIPQDINDAKLIAYLRNHAKEIINLVEAAEKFSSAFNEPRIDGFIPTAGSLKRRVEALDNMVEALAALNKEQS